MADGQQTEFFLFQDAVGEAALAAPAPTLDAEVARVWGIPIGARLKVGLRNHDVPGVSGRLEIDEMPDLPLDSHGPLALRIGHVAFNHRQIESWTRM